VHDENLALADGAQQEALAARVVLHALGGKATAFGADDGGQCGAGGQGWGGQAQQQNGRQAEGGEFHDGSLARRMAVVALLLPVDGAERCAAHRPDETLARMPRQDKRAFWEGRGGDHTNCSGDRTMSGPSGSGRPQAWPAAPIDANQGQRHGEMLSMPAFKIISSKWINPFWTNCAPAPVMQPIPSTPCCSCTRRIASFSPSPAMARKGSRSRNIRA